MTQQEIQNFLKEHPGYLKWGKYKIANKLGCKVEDVKEAKNIIKNDINVDITPLLKPYKTYKLVEKKEEENLPEVVQSPKILIMDLETAPIKAFVWRLWKQDVYIDQIISDWFLLTFSAKWLGSNEVISGRLTGKEALEESDYRIVKDLWNLIDEADIVIAHNGNSFDIPKMKARFAINGLPPTSFYQQIDTKVIAAKEFGFTSNKLDFLAQTFGISKKIHTEFELWARCMKGEDKALEEMETYNKHDVEILEEVYMKLRPYIKNHPNVTLYDDKVSHGCPTCGSEHLVEEGFYYTSVGKFQVYRCEECEALSRSRKAIKRGVTTGNLSLGR